MKSENNKDHECTIGIWYDYHYSNTITFNDLKKECLTPPIMFSLKDYLDWRRSTNITRFVYCPYCGKKIDWKGMKNSIK